LVPRSDAPTHRYIGASPGCWSIYVELLVSEYAMSPAVGGQLIVDAYAAQHPGVPGPQSSQSVAVHLMSLCAQLEHGLAAEHATARMQTYLVGTDRRRRTFDWLEPPTSLGAITVLDLLPATSAQDFAVRADHWARSVWAAWAPYHAQVRTWLQAPS
jgi:hypothetical protein